jgi:L-alanine-DL-glutamate epimerase-like enolase superfamily enzyme
MAATSTHVVGKAHPIFLAQGEGMKSTDGRTNWLLYPIPPDQQQVSNFGRLTTFDMALVAVVTDAGLRGYGEAKAQVGSASGKHTLVAMITAGL